MIIISQNAINYNLSFPKDAVLRINLAWCNNLDELKENLERFSKEKIFVDLPIGRIKPPNNRYTLDEIIPILQKYENICYFGISNVDSGNDLNEFVDKLPKRITIIPKIESPKAINNIENILEKLQYEKRFVMLDHDDLYINLKKNNEEHSMFQEYIRILIDICKKENVGLLRTVGVVFSDDEKRQTQYVS